MLVLSHDAFFGHLSSTRALDGITLSHRVANSPPEEVQAHTHTDAHFVLVTSGEYVTSASGHAVEGPTLIYNPPGTTHRDHFRHGRGSFFTISISSISDACIAPSAEMTPPPRAIRVKNHRAQGLTTALLMECARWDSCSRLKAQSICLELITEASACKLSAERSRPSWLRIACELILDCPGSAAGVADIAKSVGVHPVHLARTFREHLGCTPGDLRRARRLALAASALMTSDHSLVEIALESGFSDQPQFTKAFRQMYGVSPGVYRHWCRDVRLQHHVAF